MTVSIGDYVYSQHTTGADRDGVSWIYVERRVVLVVDGSAVTLSARETDKIPTHSAVEADIQWYASPPQAPAQTTLASIDAPGAMYTTALTLPAPEVIDEEAVSAAWLAFKNHCYVNRELGKPQPEPEDATQRYQFAIWEWRDGLPHPSAG